MTAAPRVDVEAAIDAQSSAGFGAWLTVWIGLAMVVEGYDMQVAGYAAPAIIREWGIPKAGFASVFSLGMLGYMAGALGLSTTGDRFGRRALVLSGAVLFGAATLGCAFAGSVAQMTAWRVLAGIGLGASPAPAPVGATRR